uniref:Uncharacterized protein n=1 Tax=Thermofilum pendens TaxID=2269 RepID=A0A7C4BAR3_THEPE
MKEEQWSSWPLMEEEVLVVESEKGFIFNLPFSLYRKLAAEVDLEREGLRPKVIRDMFGNKRTLLKTDKNKGLEIRAWLSLVVSEERTSYFITEVEELRAREKEI